MKFQAITLLILGSALTALALPISPAGSALERAAEDELVARGICTCLCDPCSGRSSTDGYFGGLWGVIRFVVTGTKYLSLIGI
ncbi:hypothetical protein V8F06_008748 [Rhypophila decipiens]